MPRCASKHSSIVPKFDSLHSTVSQHRQSTKQRALGLIAYACLQRVLPIHPTVWLLCNTPSLRCWNVSMCTSACPCACRRMSEMWQASIRLVSRAEEGKKRRFWKKVHVWHVVLGCSEHYARRVANEERTHDESWCGSCSRKVVGCEKMYATITGDTVKLHPHMMVMTIENENEMRVGGSMLVSRIRQVTWTWRWSWRYGHIHRQHPKV